MGRNAPRSPCFGTFDGPPPVEHPIAPECTAIKAVVCRSLGRVSAARRTVQSPRNTPTAPATSSGSSDRDAEYGQVRVVTGILRRIGRPHTDANRRIRVVTEMLRRVDHPRTDASRRVYVGTGMLRRIGRPHADASRRVRVVAGTVARPHSGYGPKHARMRHPTGRSGVACPHTGPLIMKP